jgi:hypothetical protein
MLFEVVGSRQIHAEVAMKLRIAHGIERDEIQSGIGVNFVRLFQSSS